MTTIALATERDAAGIAKVYVDAWRSAYAAILPHRGLLGMSYEHQTRQWSWTIRNGAEMHSVMVAAESDHGVVGFTSFGPARPGDRPAGFAGERDATGFAGERDTAGFAGERDTAGFGGERDATGFAAARDAKIGEIYTLYVQPEFHERGIGRRLLAAAFAAMAGKGYGCGFLWVLRDNPSRYFYERVGGKVVAERQERMWGRTVDQVCYGWPDLAQGIDRAARARQPRMDDRLGEWRRE